MKKYTASVFVKHVDHYAKPIPHPIWWRKLLGQTISHEIGWHRASYEIYAPEKVISEDWFQEMIASSLMQSFDGSEKVVWKESFQLEMNSTASPYIATSATIEAYRNNYLLNTGNV